MNGPMLSDGTYPRDSAIGLSLLLAEVVKPPFSGKFITFSDTPVVQKLGGVNDKRFLQEEVQLHYVIWLEDVD